MKVWHQSFTVLDDVPSYRDALGRHLEAVARPGVSVDLHGMIPGTYPSDYPGTHIKYMYFQNVHKEQFIKAGLDAQEAGYDAFFIATFVDIGYEEARSLLDIPVVAYGQASILVASLLGDRVGVVNFIEGLESQIRRNARVYGLHDILGPMVKIEAEFGDLMGAHDDPGPIVDAFRDAARKAIAAGANVVIPGEGPMNVFLADHGVSRVDDVPVVDSLGAGLKLCESLVDLRSTSGVGPSRHGMYFAQPPAEAVADVRSFYYRSSYER